MDSQTQTACPKNWMKAVFAESNVTDFSTIVWNLITELENAIFFIEARTNKKLNELEKPSYSSSLTIKAQNRPEAPTQGHF